MASISNILLFGSNESASLEMCRSLGRNRHHVAILRLSVSKTSAEYSRFCAESLYLGTSETSVGEYLSRLKNLLSLQRFDYLIPVDNLACELVYFDYDGISHLSKVVGPNPQAYASIRNRHLALGLAASAGLEVPNAILVKQQGQPPNPTFPCLLRPVFPVAIIEDEPQVFSERTINSAEGLDAKLRDDLLRCDVLLQVPVTGERIELNYCAIEGRVLGMTMTSCLHNPNLDGNSSYRKSVEASPSAVAIVQSVANKLAWTGFMTIECKRQADKLYFSDIKAFPAGSTTVSAYAGVDFSKLLLAGLNGGQSPEITIPNRSVYSRNLRTDFLGLLKRMAKGLKLRPAAAWLGSFRHLLSGRERFEIERLDDPLPAIRQFDGLIGSFIEKLSLRFKTPFYYLVSPKPDLKTLKKTSSLLVVCQGNINRSIVAECLFKARGFTRVRSAGLLGMSGRMPSHQAEDFLAKRLRIKAAILRSHSVARALRELNGEVDLVLCFERRQIVELARRFPNLKGKLMLLTELAGEDKGMLDIADPHGKTTETYLNIFKRIENLVDKIAGISKSSS